MKFKNYIMEKELQKPTKEMIDFYEKRTRNHINRVVKNIYTIIKERDDFNKSELIARAKIHDKSKYSKEEYIPYIWLTWWYKERNEGKEFNYPSGIKEMVDKAAKSHVLKNLHHPEAHEDPKNMSNIDIAEMVADWAAMSQELDNSLKEWADKNIGSKWKFNKEQTKLIYDLIELFEK